ncbi:MAG: hypothetical protein IJA76_04835 [Clostridia bacterium]|nr:hypothetical protein [Clostridia bacterium]MBQ4586892.1 hypothetical protein [Clostridia bacterium]
MRKFYVTYGDLANLPPAVANLPWTQNFILIEKVKDINSKKQLSLICGQLLFYQYSILK